MSSSQFLHTDNEIKQTTTHYRYDSDLITNDLIDAVKVNNMRTATFLLEQGADASASHHYFYNRPLYYAILNNDFEMVKLLLSFGADIHASDTMGNNYLHFAAYCAGCHKDYTLLNFLFAHSAVLNTPNIYGRLPIHFHDEVCYNLVTPASGIFHASPPFLPSSFYVSYMRTFLSNIVIAKGLDHLSFTQSTTNMVETINSLSRTDLNLLPYNEVVEIFQKIAQALAEQDILFIDNQSQGFYASWGQILQSKYKESLKAEEYLTMTSPVTPEISQESPTSSHLAIMATKLQPEYVATNVSQQYKTLTRQRLFSAIKNRKVDLVIKMIKDRPQLLEKTDKNGQTPLLAAIEANDPGLVNALLKAGANATTIISSSNNEAQPIHFAAANGKLLALIVLVEHQPDLLKQVDKFGQTALLWAAAKGDTDMAAYLIKQGVEVNAATSCVDNKNNHGKTVLDWAMESGKDNSRMLKLLKDAGAHTRSELREIARDQLFTAIKNKELDVVEKIFHDYPQFINEADKNNQTPLLAAIETDNSEVVKCIIKVKPIIAITKGGLHPIHIAARTGKLSALKVLIEHQPHLLDKTDKFGQTAFLWAAARGHKEAAEYLLRQGANLNVKTVSTCENNGKTPLFWAIQNGHSEVVKFLLQKGADATITVDDTMQAIHHAAKKGKLEVIKVLLEHKHPTHAISLEQTDTFGQTALLWAAASKEVSKDHIETVAYLIKQGAKVNVATTCPGNKHDGKTVLDWAMESGKANSEIVKLLKEAGALTQDELKQQRAKLQPANQNVPNATPAANKPVNMANQSTHVINNTLGVVEQKPVLQDEPFVRTEALKKMIKFLRDLEIDLYKGRWKSINIFGDIIESPVHIAKLKGLIPEGKNFNTDKNEDIVKQFNEILKVFIALDKGFSWLKGKFLREDYVYKFDQQQLKDGKEIQQAFKEECRNKLINKNVKPVVPVVKPTVASINKPEPLAPQPVKEKPQIKNTDTDIMDKLKNLHVVDCLNTLFFPKVPSRNNKQKQVEAQLTEPRLNQ